ncbi:MAG: hypothetical protein ABI876_09280, partial [Bacteroidota bacterium]
MKTLHDERLNREDDDEFREGREEWIRSMHRAEPGLNWEVINREVRMARQAELARMREEKYKSGSMRPELLGSDTVGGILRGHWVERGSNNLAGSMATADVEVNGEWEKFYERIVDLPETKGRHDLYFRFVNEQNPGGLMNLDS